MSDVPLPLRVQGITVQQLKASARRWAETHPAPSPESESAEEPESVEETRARNIATARVQDNLQRRLLQGTFRPADVCDPDDICLIGVDDVADLEPADVVDVDDAEQGGGYITLMPADPDVEDADSLIAGYPPLVASSVGEGESDGELAEGASISTGASTMTTALDDSAAAADQDSHSAADPDLDGSADTVDKPTARASTESRPRRRRPRALSSRNLRPVSDRRRSSQAANGAKAASGRSERGTEVCSQNATKTGYYVKRERISAGPLTENTAEFTAFEAGLMSVLAPRNALEQAHAREIVRLYVTGNRLSRASALVISAGDEPGPGPLFHEESLLLNLRKSLRIGQRMIEWVKEAQAAIEASGSVSWRQVIAPTLKPGEPQAFVDHLDHSQRMYESAVPGGDSSREWGEALCERITTRFDGTLDILLDYLEKQLEKDITILPSYEANAEALKAKLLAPGVQAMLGDIAMLTGLSAGLQTQIARAFSIYEGLRAMTDARSQNDAN